MKLKTLQRMKATFYWLTFALVIVSAGLAAYSRNWTSLVAWCVSVLWMVAYRHAERERDRNAMFAIVLNRLTDKAISIAKDALSLKDKAGAELAKAQKPNE